jgi:glutamine phosphoribosylpyrophosphate amidotransferase
MVKSTTTSTLLIRSVSMLPTSAIVKASFMSTNGNQNLNLTYISSALTKCILHSYGATKEALQQLDGMFAFVLYDISANLAWAARDPYGVTSLYIAEDVVGSVMIASEMKAILPIAFQITSLNEFAPGKESACQSLLV